MSDTGRFARPIKKNSTFAVREGARVPAACGAPESPLANFGSVGSAGGRGVTRGVSGAGRFARPIKKNST